MVYGPVNDGCCHGRVSDHLGPPGEFEVRGVNNGLGFVSVSDDLVGQACSFVIDREITNSSMMSRSVFPIRVMAWSRTPFSVTSRKNAIREAAVKNRTL